MDQEQLVTDIHQSYDSQALQRLYDRLGVTDEEPEGESVRVRARGLVRQMRQRGRLAELVRLVVEENLNLKDRYQFYLNRETDEASLVWLDELAMETEAVGDTGLTLRWPSSNRPLRQHLPEHGRSPIPTTTTQGLQPTFVWPETENESISPTSEADSTPGAAREDQEVAPALPLRLLAGEDEAPPILTPYTPGKPVAALQMFFGRQPELLVLRNRLLAGEHTIITGPPAIGKSSLQYAFLRQGFPAEYQFLLSWLDLANSRYHTLSGLLNGMWQQWWRQIRPDMSPALRDMEQFATAIGKLRRAGFQPVVCLDGLEHLLKRPDEFDDELFETWRELVEQRQLLMIASSWRPLADLLQQAGFTTRFYARFSQLDLGLLDEQSARDLLTVPPQQRGLKIPAGAVTHLLHLCGPHPLFLHIAGKLLFERLAVQSYSWAEVKERFAQAAEPYWQTLWQGLSPLAQEHFPLKPTIPASGMAARQFRLLAGKGLLIAEGERYRPFSEGFAFWVRGNR